ncbi:MAG: YbjQ family protein [Eubacterium sp.]
MLVVTTETITGRNFEMLGIVAGNTVRSKNLVKDFGAGMKSIVGGELGSYQKMLAEAREIAMQRMIEQAEAMGADAVVNVRFSSSAIMQGAAEIVASGTAVKYI